MKEQNSDNDSNRSSSPPPKYSQYQDNLIAKKKKKKFKSFKSNKKINSNKITNLTSPNIYSIQSTIKPEKLEMSNVKVTSGEINQLYPESPAKEFQKTNHYFV